jgi:TolB-like protein/DNA-binding winged helix-turn-helix (wHTH) protein
MSLEREEIYEFGNFRLDVGERYLLKRGRRVQLTDKAFDILSLLVREKGRLISKDELLSMVWPDSFVEENNLDKNVSRIRRVLGERKTRPKFIETVRGRGYRFVPDVVRIGPRKENAALVPRSTSLPAPLRTVLPAPAAMSEAGRSRTVVALADWKFEQEANRVISSDDVAVAKATGEDRPARSAYRSIFIAAAGLVIIVGSLALYKLRPSQTSTGAPFASVAVLPFTNESGNAELDYLADGLSENLIDNLAQISSLKVIARTSSFQYRGPNIDLAETATRLGVQAIVTGRVSKRDDYLLVRVEMIGPRDNRLLWSEQYVRKAADLFALQEEISRSASERLRLTLSGVEARRLEKNYSESTEAYQLYLRGHYLQYRSTPQDLFKSIDCYQQAIAIDPKFALAYVGLAESIGRLNAFRDVPKQDYKKLARGYVEKALSLDDQLPEAHATLGSLLSMMDYDFVGAEREYLRALELNPNYSEAYLWRGQLLSSLGRHDEALTAIKRGIELDPLSVEANSIYGEALFFARRYDESIEQLKRVLLLDSNKLGARRFLAFNYEILGKYDERIAESVKINEIGGTPERGLAIRKSYDTGGWRGFLRDACKNKFDIHEYLVATWCAELGEKDRSIAILNEQFSRRESNLVLINVDPRLDNLRDDPRFQELLVRVGFAK